MGHSLFKVPQIVPLSVQVEKLRASQIILRSMLAPGGGDDASGMSGNFQGLIVAEVCSVFAASSWSADAQSDL